MKTAIKISPLFIIMAVAMAYFGTLRESLIYFTAVIFHELAHSEMAKRCGYVLSGLKLMPYGASLTGNFEVIRPIDEIKIALAGPLVNLFISLVCVATWWLFPSSYFFTEGIVFCNTSLAIFNLVPIYPLDGGRVILALASKKIPRQRAYAILRKAGYVAATIFIFAFVVSVFVSPNPSFAVIGLFIVVSTAIPDKVNSYQRVYGIAYMSERVKRGLPIREIVVDSEQTLLELDKMLNSNYYTIFFVADPKMSLTKRISETELENLATKHGFNKKICDFM